MQYERKVKMFVGDVLTMDRLEEVRARYGKIG